MDPFSASSESPVSSSPVLAATQGIDTTGGKLGTESFTRSEAPGWVQSAKSIRKQGAHQVQIDKALVVLFSTEIEAAGTTAGGLAPVTQRQQVGYNAAMAKDGLETRAMALSPMHLRTPNAIAPDVLERARASGATVSKAELTDATRLVNDPEAGFVPFNNGLVSGHIRCLGSTEVVFGGLTSEDRRTIPLHMYQVVYNGFTGVLYQAADPNKTLLQGRENPYDYSWCDRTKETPEDRLKQDAIFNAQASVQVLKTLRVFADTSDFSGGTVIEGTDWLSAPLAIRVAAEVAHGRIQKVLTVNDTHNTYDQDLVDAELLQLIECLPEKMRDDLTESVKNDRNTILQVCLPFVSGISAVSGPFAEGLNSDGGWPVGGVPESLSRVLNYGPQVVGIEHGPFEDPHPDLVPLVEKYEAGQQKEAITEMIAWKKQQREILWNNVPVLTPYRWLSEGVKALLEEVDHRISSVVHEGQVAYQREGRAHTRFTVDGVVAVPEGFPPFFGSWRLPKDPLHQPKVVGMLIRADANSKDFDILANAIRRMDTDVLEGYRFIVGLRGLNSPENREFKSAMEQLSRDYPGLIIFGEEGFGPPFNGYILRGSDLNPLLSRMEPAGSPSQSSAAGTPTVKTDTGSRGKANGYGEPSQSYVIDVDDPETEYPRLEDVVTELLVKPFEGVPDDVARSRIVDSNSYWNWDPETPLADAPQWRKHFRMVQEVAREDGIDPLYWSDRASAPWWRIPKPLWAQSQPEIRRNEPYFAAVSGKLAGILTWYGELPPEPQAIVGLALVNSLKPDGWERKGREVKEFLEGTLGSLQDD